MDWPTATVILGAVTTAGGIAIKFFIPFRPRGASNSKGDPKVIGLKSKIEVLEEKINKLEQNYIKLNDSVTDLKVILEGAKTRIEHIDTQIGSLHELLIDLISKNGKEK